MKQMTLAAVVLLAAWPLAACTAEGVEHAFQKHGSASTAAPSAARERCQGDPERCREQRAGRMSERFSTADVDGNGALSRAEAEQSMRGLARRFDQVDANRDGHLTQDEILAWRTNKRRAACQAAPEQCFGQMQARLTKRVHHADTDGNGTLSRLEVEQSMPRLGRRFDTIDANRDGQVTVEEILATRRARTARHGATP